MSDTSAPRVGLGRRARRSPAVRTEGTIPVGDGGKVMQLALPLDGADGPALDVPIDRPSFSGHESFPLRFGWLKKGFDALRVDPRGLSSPEAMSILGVGKNMVRSIRHWGIACRTWEEVAGSRGADLQPTQLGLQLLADDGWDPYLEDPGTIWLLHYQLVTSRTRATTWAWVFGRPRGNRFSRDELVTELLKVAGEFVCKRPTRSSLRRDIEVLVRSYARVRDPRDPLIEDTLDSPFMTLGLMRPGLERGVYEILQGVHRSLPQGVFEAIVLQYCASYRRNPSASISLDELLYAPFSPGRALRLTEGALAERLNRLVENYPDVLVFDETAGLRQLLLRAELPSPLVALTEYYARGRSRKGGRAHVVR